MLLRPAGSFLFISSWFMRWSNATAPVMTAMMLGWIGILVALFASCLGGELVYRLNVGVDLGATLYAPIRCLVDRRWGLRRRRSTRGVIRAR